MPSDWISSKGWKYASREISIAYAIILVYEHDGSGSKYVKLDTPVRLMGKYKLANALSEIVDDLGSIEEISKFFDPSVHYAKTKIKASNRLREFSMSPLTAQTATVDPLPDSFTP